MLGTNITEVRTTKDEYCSATISLWVAICSRYKKISFQLSVIQKAYNHLDVLIALEENSLLVMDVLRSRMYAARAIACSPRAKSRDANTDDKKKEAIQLVSTATEFSPIQRNLMSSYPNGSANQTAFINQPNQVQVGSCITARRRIGRTQRGQDPLSYKIGPFTFHTFRAMDPDNGCLCRPSQFPRCRRPCRRVIEMRKENYLNSLQLMHMPEHERRKLIGDRDPVMVLISRAHKYNARFITEKTVQRQDHVFEEMRQMDSIVQMMKDSQF